MMNSTMIRVYEFVRKSRVLFRLPSPQEAAEIEARFPDSDGSFALIPRVNVPSAATSANLQVYEFRRRTYTGYNVMAVALVGSSIDQFEAYQKAALDALQADDYGDEILQNIYGVWPSFEQHKLAHEVIDRLEVMLRNGWNAHYYDNLGTFQGIVDLLNEKVLEPAYRDIEEMTQQANLQLQ